MIARRPSAGVVAFTAIAVFAILAVVLGLVWFTSDFREARAVWEDKEPDAYSFDYEYCSGMCASCRVHVTVRNEKVTEAVAKGQCPRRAADGAPTIDDVFDMEASDRLSQDFYVRYDPEWGFPASVSSTCWGDTDDCGRGYTVTNFQVIG
ncbi:DUF6174 domain-containing protein [Nocardioides sp.]|uniref:DUF6174 domain-containing protein n=1 Tax=Nocardioides sp. TaxID=35761 RepID=UPI002BE654C1|nr:DUF6174 domain-containing protein [Nocardioides sp.]HXH77667.1 DUF6174 domain-containing protein [Nocardioides sp.]